MNNIILLSIIIFTQTEKWVYRYNGPANQYDAANQVVYGNDGNIYAGGYRWDTQYFMQFTVISLDTAGNQRWMYIPESLPSGESKCIVYGDDGNIYTGGELLTGSQDFIVISLDSAGNERWTYITGGGYDFASSVIYGKDGNIYAAGRIRSDSGSRDLCVVSLDTLGNERWVYFYHQTGLATYGSATSLVYGEDDNIYVSGYVTIPYDTWRDLIVIKLDTAGNQKWVYKYITSSNDAATSIIYGMDSNLYIGGYSSEYSVENFTVICLDTLMNERWVYKYDDIFQNNAVSAVLYGLDGNIYAAGYSDSSYFNRDIIVVSLTGSGNERWTYKYDAEGLTDSATSIAYDLYNRIYVSGKITTNDNYDLCIISLDTLGNNRWVYTYDNSQDDESYSVALGEGGNLYSAGYSTGSWTGQDFIVINLEDGVDIREKTFYKIYQKVELIPAIIKKNDEFNIKLDAEKIKVFNITGTKVYTGIPKGSSFTIRGNMLKRNGIFYLLIEKNKKLEPLKKIIFLK